MPTADGQGRSDADLAALGQAKQVLRRAVLTRRAMRTEQQRRDDDDARFTRMRDGLPTGLHTAAAYLSTPPEPSTIQLVAWLAALDLQVLLPVLGDWIPSDDTEPTWGLYAGPDQLSVGPRSILEPTGAVLGPEALQQAQLVVCPGLAGNELGARLGRGGGWYDRALAHANPAAPVWLLLNDDEVMEVIPSQPWDRRVDVIITPSRVLLC